MCKANHKQVLAGKASAVFYWQVSQCRWSWSTASLLASAHGPRVAHLGHHRVLCLGHFSRCLGDPELVEIVPGDPLLVWMIPELDEHIAIAVHPADHALLPHRELDFGPLAAGLEILEHRDRGALLHAFEVVHQGWRARAGAGLAVEAEGPRLLGRGGDRLLLLDLRLQRLDVLGQPHFALDDLLLHGRHPVALGLQHRVVHVHYCRVRLKRGHSRLHLLLERAGLNWRH
mmetsp:Transcript_75939/g.198049  ORF Transcript_75939/g.198049 Transcript_75939/m.198049 type:complete len:230 (+) Transcript_75939:377-1066(+)